jgi:hypothetical protein
MKRSRFSIVLPCAQVLLALALWRVARHDDTFRRLRLDTLYAPTAWLVSNGINAPAILFRWLGRPFDASAVNEAFANRFDFELSEAAFFVGVAVVWFLVGRAIDLRIARDVAPATPPRGNALSTFMYILLGLLGALFAVEGFYGFRNLGRWNNPHGNLIQDVLFLAWAIALLYISTSYFTDRFRAQPSRNSPRSPQPPRR